MRSPWAYNRTVTELVTKGNIGVYAAAASCVRGIVDFESASDILRDGLNCHRSHFGSNSVVQAYSVYVACCRVLSRRNGPEPVRWQWQHEAADC